MFEIGFSEILMVGLVSLLVLGPERLPQAARFVGFWLGKMRVMMSNAKAEFEHELQIEEMRQLLKEQSGLSQMQQLSAELSQTAESIRNSIGGEEMNALYEARKAQLQQLVQEGVMPPQTVPLTHASTTPKNDNSDHEQA